jgi:nitrogen fixation protein FixH
MLEIDPQTARKNMLLGWALFGVFVLLFGGTIAVAYVYLWIAG